jgi:uncharacterized protein (TIGR02246 family)
MPPRYQRRQRSSDRRHITILAAVPTDTPTGLAEAFAAAINSGDVATAVDLWVDDAAIVQPNGTALHGKAAVESALQALVDNDVRMEIEVDNVFVADDVAMVLGALTLSGTNGERLPYSQRSNSVVIYRRGPDGWRVAIDTPWGLPAT